MINDYTRGGLTFCSENFEFYLVSFFYFIFFSYSRSRLSCSSLFLSLLSSIICICVLCIMPCHLELIGYMI